MPRSPSLGRSDSCFGHRNKPRPLRLFGTLAASACISCTAEPMKTPLFSILCCCFSLVIAGCGGKPASHENTPTKANSYFKTPFQDESEFIVETILTDLAEMTL